MTLRKVIQQLRNKGRWYWARVFCIACVGVFLNSWLTRHPPQWMLAMRLAAYQVISTFGPRAPHIGHLAIVEISDDEYWRGSLAGRRPLKRGYIASLVKALCNDGAQVIGLDFDMRSPVQDGSLANHPDYKSETEELVREINEAPRRCKIILPRTLNCPNPPDGNCAKEQSVLDEYSFDPNRVTWGYINLPGDIRQIPLKRDNVESGTIESFAQAIAAADSPHVISPLKAPREFPFGSFIPEKSFRQQGAVLAARSVLTDRTNETAGNVSGKTILVGGSWHANALGRGPIIDSHASPVGSIPGIFLHANYAAALLDGRTYASAGQPIVILADSIIVAGVAVFFALPMSWWRRWLWICVLALALIVVSYIFWQNFGMFLDATIPAILLLVHALLDQYAKMREELKELRSQLKESGNHKSV